MKIEWDPAKADSNVRKHGIDFADAAAVLFDELALTVVDESEGEERFVTIGVDALGPDARGDLGMARRERPDDLRAHGDST